MTKNPYIAGLAAGCVAALLYLSLATGSGMGLLLFYLAPLPGFIAGFGWGVRAAGVAALAGTGLILASLGFTPAIAYGVSLAVPSVIITNFASLYRLSGDPSQQQEEPEQRQIEWYPVGNLMLIVALYGGLLAMMTVLLLGTSYEAYLDKVGSQLDLIISKAIEAGFFKKLKPEVMGQYKSVVQAILPASTAVLWCLLAYINMWIAAHIVRLSEKLSRPWPDLSRIEFSYKSSFALIGLFFLSFSMPGIGGLILSGFAGAMMIAFLLMGLAVLHYLTRPYPARGLILFGTYITIFFIGWGAIFVIILGVVEPLVQIRRRANIAPS
ncbi:MAG: DUF2232 domain-containing protein [bacterium]|nr:DUF2232 domain-containing protein [bacterium]